jgi:hypothetical protein
VQHVSPRWLKIILKHKKSFKLYAASYKLMAYSLWLDYSVRNDFTGFANAAFTD